MRADREQHDIVDRFGHARTTSKTSL